MLAALKLFQIPSPSSASQSARLAHLRAQVGALDGSLSPEVHTAPDLPVGLPKGAVVELLGPARYEYAAKLLAEKQTLSVWVQKDLSFFPTALLQRGVSLERSVFVEGGQNINWVLKQVLQAQIFPFVIGEDLQLPEKDLRRLQLLAERSGATLLHLCSDYRPSWVPMLSVHLEHLMHPDGSVGFRSQILRKRGAL
jgi:hypothetical protein